MLRQVIIVEDDMSTRRSLVRWAKACGYEAVGFASASAFLACDIHATESCLILDVGLPDINGADLKRRLIAEHRDLPTVFITALTEPETAAALRGLEDVPVLRKPFDTAALAAAIKAASSESLLVIRP